MKREGVDFPEALRILADRAGIALAPTGQKRAEPGSPDDKQTLYRAMAWAEEQFHRCLLDAPEAEPARAVPGGTGHQRRQYRAVPPGFLSRQLAVADRSSQDDAVLARRAGSRRFGQPIAGRATRLRSLSRSLDLLDSRHGASPDRLWGTYPAADRAADNDGPKYVNSPETRLFTKSNHLYALDFVRDSLSHDPRIVVVEGYTDVIMAHQHGIRNVVAALGTALGERHVRLLQRFADQITLVLDGDEAGQRRTNEILELFIAAQVDLQILTLPAGLDPCDFIRQQGPEAFRELLDRAVDALEHKTRTVTAGLDVVQHPDKSHRALEEILKTMANAPRLSGVTSQSLRLREQQMLVRLARQFHVDETSLRARLAELRQRRQPSDVPRSSSADAGPANMAQMLPMELELFHIVLVHPELVETAFEAVLVGQLSSSLAGQLWQLYRRAP